MRISEAITEFQAEHVSRGSSPKTIHNYKTMLTLVLRPYLELELSELTPFVITKCLSAMVDRNVKPATLATADRTLRAFCNWLVGIELLDRNPMQNKQKPKLRHQPKPVLTDTEVQAMFNAIKADRRHSERNRAILYLLLSTGIRAGELCNLTLSDIDWNNGILSVQGKTGYGTVPMDRKTMQILRRYITHSRKATIPQLFVYGNRPLNTQGLSRLIHRIAERAGINRPIGPHAMRHKFATEFIEQNGDPFALKRILRHTTLDTSMRYVQHSTTSIRNKMEGASALRNIKL